MEKQQKERCARSEEEYIPKAELWLIKNRTMAAPEAESQFESQPHSRHFDEKKTQADVASLIRSSCKLSRFEMILAALAVSTSWTRQEVAVQRRRRCAWHLGGVY